MKRWKKQEQRRVYFVLAYFRTRFRTGSQLKAHFNMWKYLSRSCPRRRETSSDILSRKIIFHLNDQQKSLDDVTSTAF